MGIPWKAVGKLGLGIAAAVVPQIGVVEDAARALGHGKGKQKEDAVLEMVKAALESAEGLAHKDILDDSEVEAATRGVITAVVALHNIVEAKKNAKP